MSDFPLVRAQIDPTAPFQFYALGAVQLQRMCRDIFLEMKEVDAAFVYGTNGYGQRGIDIEIRLAKSGLWVSQVKACEEKHQMENLNEAVKEFGPHLEYWRAQGLRKFIVILGCGVEKPATIDRLREYEQQFKAQKLKFELWDSYHLRKLLRRMPNVAETYFREPLLSLLLGSGMQVEAVGAALRLPSAVEEFLGDTQNQRLDEIRDLIRSGAELEAEKELRSLIGSKGWAVLTPALQARVYRLLGAIALNRRDNVEEAESFLRQAKGADPQGRAVVLETVIRHRRLGPEAALKEMPDPTSQDEWNLMGALMLNAGKADDAMRFLGSSPFDSDAKQIG